MWSETRRLWGACALCLALAAPGVAAAEVTAITGGEVHTVSGEVIPGGVVVLGEDGTIQAVGPEGTPVPAGAVVVDAAGKVVTPGLIDAHTQLGLIEIWAVTATRDSGGAEGPVRASYVATDGYDPGSAVIPVQRAGGVTDAVVVPSGGVVSGFAGWTTLADAGSPHLEGKVVAPKVALSVTLGASGAGAAGGSRGLLVAMLRDLFADAAFLARNGRAFDEGRSRKLAASRVDLLALGEVLSEEGAPVLFHVNRVSGIRAALALAAENGLRPVIVGGAQAWKVADELAAAKAVVVLNTMANLPSRFESLGARSDAAALLHAAGVEVVVATFESHNVRKLRQFAGNAVRAGLPHSAALRAVTLAPAQALGEGARRGSLEPGKVANVVVWSGDPFELSTKVEAMFVDGAPVDLGSRQTDLLERYRELDRRGEPAAPPEPERGDAEEEGDDA
jgi:imidazolonepropionase-like amidohydrolase